MLHSSNRQAENVEYTARVVAAGGSGWSREFKPPITVPLAMTADRLGANALSVSRIEWACYLIPTALT